MAVSKIMTKSLVTVSSKTTVDEMRRILHTHPIHHLLVVEEKKLVGIISDRDILRTLSPFANSTVATEKDNLTLTRQAQQIMTRKPVTTLPTATLLDAAKILLENKVSVLPVVNSEGQLVGILSWKDVLRHIVS